jgi:molybdopterin synthase sulfur carrier subunit
MALSTVTLRFFAAARAAMGLDEIHCVSEQAPTLGELVSTLAPASGVDPDELAAVLERSSFLVDGVSTRDRSLVVASGAVVDVMPPFAGG